jgi:hypothetical protein
MSLNESHVAEAALECSFASLNPSPRPSPTGRGRPTATCRKFASLNPSPRPSPTGRGKAGGHPAAESGHCTLATVRDTLLPKLLSGVAKELLK